jgi:hypothetical protein
VIPGDRIFKTPESQAKSIKLYGGFANFRTNVVAGFPDISGIDEGGFQ